MVENKIKFKKIYIVTDSPMPIGMAPASRIFAYATGLIRHRKNVEIIIFRKTENPSKIINKENKGVFEGVRYRYLLNSTVKSSNFIKRRIDNLDGIIKLFYLALFKIKRNEVLIFYSSYTLPVIALKLAKYFNNFLFLKEESEHPSIYLKSMWPLQSLIFKNIHYRLFDGFLLMTKNLFNYFEKKYSAKPIVQIPMTVDLERFNKLNNIRQKKITYVGTLNDKKDGINVLINSFAKVSKRFKDYKLELYGDTANKSVLSVYKAKVIEVGAKNKILFKGKIDREKIPQILSESSVLILPRPDSLQARNGFPTKLGEYLATGRPVVATSVGEIPNYLKDGENAFLAKPGDADSLTDKIFEVLQNYEFALKVGEKGKQIAEKYFNNVIQTKKIIDFIEEF